MSSGFWSLRHRNLSDARCIRWKLDDPKMRGVPFNFSQSEILETTSPSILVERVVTIFFLSLTRGSVYSLENSGSTIS